MPREFTAEQLRAVNTRGKDILVSAAAGSGKTAVLVERIAELNCINRLLVVTFTEDAALEMKSRLVQRLSEKSEAAASDEEQDEILRQLALVPSAHVSTIHAFCKRLLKQYFHLTDADPGARIGDKAELELISGRAMEELFEEEYAKENNADFFDLVESYGGKKTDDDKLDELIKKYFLFIESSDYPEYTALKYAAMYDGVSPGNAADVWLEPVKKEISAVLDGAEAKLQMSFSICGEPSGPLEYKKAINDDLNQIDFLRDCLNGTLHEICKAFKLLTFPTIHTYRVKDEIDPVLKNRAKNLRDSAKTDLRDLVSRFLFASAEKLTADIEALGPAVRTLTKLTLAYREKYRALKRERGLLDFNDLEHYAVSILLDGGPENPVPSAAALEISKKYNEILIDEYQDSNAVQELILWAVSGGGAVPRFMVGDLKQSVYKFRRASPEIFIGKYLSYSIDVNSCSGLKIDLNKNFRSRPAVLDAVNFFFRQLMSPSVGDIEYGDETALYPGAVYPPEVQDSPVTIQLIEPQAAEDLPEEDDAGLKQEARAVTEQIHLLLASGMVFDSEKKEYRKCTAGDIVVLMRSAVDSAHVFAEELRLGGVNAAAEMSGGFFKTAEVQTALSFLRVTDNPLQEIDLTVALRSPVYGATPDELMEIRLAGNSEMNFFDCLKRYAEKNRNEKIDRFLNDLERWRGKSIHLPVNRLLSLILNESGYADIAGRLPGGQARQANLSMLVEYAVSYEQTSFKGLFHFVRFIERLRRHGAEDSLDAAASLEAGDYVRVMTIHKSKGLEFPVVFVSRLGQKMNRRSETGNVVLHHRLGIGPKRVDLKKRTSSNTLARSVLAREIRRESLSEELRVLYVAMTRAKEALYLTGCVSNPDEKIDEWSAFAKLNKIQLPDYYVREANSFLDWIVPCALRKNTLNLTADIVLLRTEGSAERLRPAPAATAETSEPPAPVQEFVYPYESAVSLPSKITVTELKRMYAIETSPDSAQFDPDPDHAPVFEMPRFIRSKEAGITPARMGVLLHTAAEHIDFNEHRTFEGIEKLLVSMKTSGLFTQAEYDAVDRKKIFKLANSPLACRIRAAKRLYRELPFVMKLPSEEINAAAGETVMVHGIIDCCFEEPDGMVIVDYKSGAADDPRWASLYEKQLEIYKKAVILTAGINVKETLIYSFA